jgi:ribosomal protein L7/L12
MPRLNITGWRVGLKKISMTHALQEHLGLGLKDAKGAVDKVANGEAVSFVLEEPDKAEALAKALEAVGAIVELSD